MTSIPSRYGVVSVKPHARPMAKVGARPQDVLATSTAGMRHGSVVVDARGEVPLATPTRDGRGALQGLQLAGERGREFHERTGHFPAPLFMASRLLWMADSAPELLGRAHAVLGLSDWLAYRLSGKMVAEPSVASESGLFEVSTRRWADDLMPRRPARRRTTSSRPSRRGTPTRRSRSPTPSARTSVAR